MLLLALQIFCGLVYAQPSDQVLIKPYPKEPLLNEVIQFEPLKGHKFNVQAGNQCGNGRLLTADEKKMECQMYAPGKSTLELYVCDDAKTFCRREEFEIKTQSPSGIWGWFSYYKASLDNPDKWKAPARSDKSAMIPVKGFIMNDLAKARAQAKKEKKRILIYMTQLTCVPCRMLKEVTLDSDQFQNDTKDYVKLQIDVDVEQDPAIGRDLEVFSTPTLIVFNKDFDELGRQNEVISPDNLKKWLDQISETPLSKLEGRPYESPKDLKDPKKKEYLAESLTKKLDDNEKFRLSQWWALKASDKDNHKSMRYVNAIFNPTVEMQFWKMLLDESHTKNAADALALFKKMEALLPQVPPHLVEIYTTHLFIRGYMIAEENNKAEYQQLLAFYIKAEELVRKQDPVQRDLDLVSIYSSLQHGYKKFAMTKEYKKAGEKLAAVVDNFTKPAGVTHLPYLTMERNEALGDTASKEKIVAQLREENKDDSSLDFMAAYTAFEDKKYDEALALVEKSMAIAKDRSWQKGFLLKLDILEAQNKKAEATQLIDKTLKEVELPVSSSIRVHRFVQNLRKKQRDLAAG